MEVNLVLILVITKLKIIVQIHQNKVIDVTMHDRIHEALEGTWCITQPKLQNGVLKQAIMHYKNSFFTCVWCQSNLVVPTGQVNGTKTHCL